MSVATIKNISKVKKQCYLGSSLVAHTNRLRIWCCHNYGTGCKCCVSSIPDPGASTRHGCIQKQTNKQNEQTNQTKTFLIQLGKIKNTSETLSSRAKFCSLLFSLKHCGKAVSWSVLSRWVQNTDVILLFSA